ncbi:MAG: class I SAM-dependent methyltransferase [Beijerinckiaceae bacterium]
MQQIDSEEKWPETDLEYLGKCPACDSGSRSKLFDDIRDYAFHVAPGTWTLWRCGGCEAAYLDPRPTESSIGRAYKSYYTHAKPRSAVLASRKDLVGRVKLGYYNSAFGYNFETGLSVGKIVFKISRTIASSADFGIRHLPAPEYEGAALLDIGCGNGSFLLTARDLGYAAVGLEPDEDAVRQARAIGLDVRMGMVPNSGLPAGSFEQICLSHVFEHLHKPRQAAEEIFQLLRPGGRVWLSQPNLDSVGLSIFGEFWRGLEAPRHLSLHTRESLTRLLNDTGFVDVQIVPAETRATFYFQQSLSMRHLLNPQQTPIPPDWGFRWRERARAANRIARRAPHRGESLTMTARRPG